MTTQAWGGQGHTCCVTKQRPPALTAVVIGALAVFFGARDGLSPTRLVLVFLGAAVFAYAGAGRLAALQGKPVFEHRIESNFAMWLTVGPSLGIVYLLGPGSTSTAATIALVIAGEAAFFALMWAITSPRRGGGWLMKFTARGRGLRLCPTCRMVTPSDALECNYCGSLIAGS